MNGTIDTVRRGRRMSESQDPTSREHHHHLMEWTHTFALMCRRWQVALVIVGVLFFVIGLVSLAFGCNTAAYGFWSGVLGAVGLSLGIGRP